LETTTDYPNYQQYTRNFSNMINYIYNQLYNLQGLFVRVSDCEELVGVTQRISLGKSRDLS